MSIEVNVKQEETIERVLRRFKSKLARESLLRELRRRKQYEKPNITKKKNKVEIKKKIARERSFKNKL